MSEAAPPPAAPGSLRERVVAFTMRRALAAVVLTLAAALPASAQMPGAVLAPTPAAADEAASDPYSREPRYGTFFGFLRAIESGSYANAAEYLQIPASLRSEREDITREFQAVLNHRFVSTNLERVSRSARGTIDDGLPPE